MGTRLQTFGRSEPGAASSAEPMPAMASCLQADRPRTVPRPAKGRGAGPKSSKDFGPISFQEIGGSARLVERAVDGELVEAGLLRLDRAEAFAHARLGQLALHGQQDVGRVFVAEIGHMGDFLARHGQGGVYIR